MSDAPYTPQGGNLDIGLPIGKALGSDDLQRWIAAGRMAETWLPSYFHSRYDVIDSSVNDPSLRWVRLGDLVEQYAPSPILEGGAAARWLIETTATSLTFTERPQGQDLPADFLLLPAQAVLLQLTSGNALNVEYWDDILYPGGGAASRDLLILTTTKLTDPAWIAWELRTNDLVALQIERARRGVIVSRVDRSQLFGLWLPLPSPEEQTKSANALRGIVRENQSLVRAHAIIETARRTQRTFNVTGATLQDRLRQFEDYLQGESWIAPDSIYALDRIQGTSKFTLKPIQPKPQRALGSQASSSPPTEIDAEPQWLEWSASSEGIWKIFNGLLGKEDLPRAILAGIIANTGRAFVQNDETPGLLPTFDLFRQLFRSIWDLQGALNPSDWSQIPGMWLNRLRAVADHDPAPATREQSRRTIPEALLIDTIRRVVRPILALKAINERNVVRIYLILGPDQTDDPSGASALLEGYASILAENLNRATHFATEAARKESIRRLSWLRHHLNGPLGVASVALADIQEYLQHHSAVAVELVPTREIAHKRASRPGRSIEQYTLEARLDIVEREFRKLKALSERIRQLSEIGDSEAHEQLDVASVLRERGESCRELVPGLVLEIEGCRTPLMIVGHSAQLGEAFGEILFNACRELTEQQVSEPHLTLNALLDDAHATITVQDNALPCAESLPANPFNEGVSKYRGVGGGTGLGLTMVRDIVADHGGRCCLEENRTQDGIRSPGTTFRMTIPVTAETETQ